MTLHYIPAHIRKQLEDAHQQRLHDQVLFSHNHRAFTIGKKKINIHYFHPDTGERLDVRVYKSPIDRPSTCKTKSHKAIIITARGKCLPRPVLLARCPGHVEVLKIWNPDSDRTDKIVKWQYKEATTEELQARIKLLAFHAEHNAIAAQARKGVVTTKPAVLEPANIPAAYNIRAKHTGLSTTGERDISQQEVVSAPSKANLEPETATTKINPTIAEIIDLTSDDDLTSAQVKQEVIDENDIKKETVIFFKSAGGVIARKSPLSEIANARSLYLHFTTAFELNTTEDVLMLASINGGRATRLVSNCKGDFDTLWLAIRNDMCWYTGSEARLMCKVDMRMG